MERIDELFCKLIDRLEEAEECYKDDSSGVRSVQTRISEIYAGEIMADAAERVQAIRDELRELEFPE